MSYSGNFKQQMASKRREERQSLKRQRELQRQLKHQQKLTDLERARLEVESYLNSLDVILSVHKESAPEVDWAAPAFALPPSPPFAVGKASWLCDLRQKLAPILLSGSTKPDPVANGNPPDPIPSTVEAAALIDLADANEKAERHERQLIEWRTTRDLGRRILAGEHSAYIEAVTEYSNLSELSTLGFGIHFSVHGPRHVEFSITVNGREIIPAQVKSLTATGKVSTKAMPQRRFHEIYQDYVCGCVLRVTRELFALLPVDTVLAHACVPSLDSATGQSREKLILSVVINRSDFNRLDFDRLDPSDTIATFRHRGSVMASRATGDFKETMPLGFGDSASLQTNPEDMGAFLERLQSAHELLTRFTTEKLASGKLKIKPIPIPE